MTGSRTTGVWISADSATVLGWSPELTVRQRIDSTVPGRHRSTGRRPIRAGGGQNGGSTMSSPGDRMRPS